MSILDCASMLMWIPTRPRILLREYILQAIQTYHIHLYPIPYALFCCGYRTKFYWVRAIFLLICGYSILRIPSVALRLLYSKATCVNNDTGDFQTSPHTFLDSVFLDNVDIIWFFPGMLLSEYIITCPKGILHRTHPSITGVSQLK